MLFMPVNIKNIEDLKDNINWSSVIVFFLIFGLSLAGLLFVHGEFLQKRAQYEKQEVITIEGIYKSNLSEKLSIIASSTEFLDYLRSGESTRNHLYPQFLSQLATLKAKSIAGMELIDRSGRLAFSYGKATDSYVELDLCYLNQTLDPEMGICEFAWKLYFDKEILQNELLRLNKSLQICEQCTGYSLVNDSSFGSFPVRISSGLKFNLVMAEEKDYFFYIYFLLMTASLILLTSWSWYRLSSILNNYIANPIKNLAASLKANEVLAPQDNIEEVEYLIKEINTWKMRVNKAQESAHAAKLGKISAQLAHDIRSPLMAIDMISKKINQLPDCYKEMLHQAVQRISEIANNFLLQYKNKTSENVALNQENIADLLKIIIDEKRQQYGDQSVMISLLVENEAQLLSCKINANDFKCVISNIINNAVESVLNDVASIDVNLIYDAHYVCITITDNGKGIPAEYFSNIFSGVSIGKNGTGLGLSHAKSKLTEWHGDITIESEIGKGTRVNIKIPIMEE